MSPGSFKTVFLLGALGGSASLAHAEIPISIASTGHAVVPVDVEGHARVTFVLDTGADETVLYRHFVQALDLEAQSSASLHGQTGAADVDIVRMPAFAVDGRAFMAKDTFVLPDRADGVPLNGILGIDIMRDYLADIDYPRERFALRDAAEEPNALLSKNAVAVRVRRLETGLIAFPVVVNGVTGTAVLDTGSRDTRLNSAFIEAAKITAAPETADSPVIFGATNSPLSAKPVVLGTFEVAGKTHTAFPARAIDLPVFDTFGLGEEPALILGHDMLRTARLVIDSARDTVWFDWADSAPR